MRQSFGIVTQSNPIYAIGASVMLGRTQRVSLTIGEAVGKVSRLSGDRLVNNEPVPLKVGDQITTTAVPTASRYMWRPFISLSYNF